MLRMGCQPGIGYGNAQLFEMGGDNHGTSTMFPHPDRKMGKSLDEVKGGPWIHGWAEKHGAAGMQVLQLINELSTGAYRTCNHVAGAADILCERMDHHISTKNDWRDQSRCKRVVHHQFSVVLPGDLGQFWNISYLERWISNGFHIQHFGIRCDGAIECLHIGGVNKGGLDPHFRQHLIQQGMGTSVNGTAGDDVISRSTKLKQGAGDGRHAAGGCNGCLGIL